MGCSRRSAADTDRSTSVDRTLFSDPARSPPAIRCGASSGGDDRTTKSDCRDLLGHHRSSEQYDEHPHHPDGVRTPETPHPPSRTANALRCGTVAVLASCRSRAEHHSHQQNSRHGAVARQHPRGIDTDRAHPIRPRETQLLGRRQHVFQSLQIRHVFRGRGDRDVWFTPPSIGPNPARSYRRNSSQNPSARRNAGVRVSLTPSFSGVGADRLDTT